MHLFLKEGTNRNRTIILATSSADERAGCPSKALVLHAAEGKYVSQAVVKFLPKKEVDMTNAIKLTTHKVKGCLGLINAADDIFVAVVISATEVGNTRPSTGSPEIAARIHEVGFFSLKASTWDNHNGTDGLSGVPGTEFGELALRDSQNHAAIQNQTLDHPCAAMKKLLSSGTFYYASAPHWDISSRLYRRVIKDKTAQNDIFSYDKRFVWNEYIIRCLLDLRDKLDIQEREDIDRCQFIILTIQGYVGVFTIPLPAPPSNGMPVIATLSLISRLGWKRAGTRFNTRGVDDDGNCANFVETETIFSTEESCCSYVQVRGSVPLFWEQQGIQTFGQRIQVTRPQASLPAFERHFSNLVEEYRVVHAINLLGSKENEAILTSAYTQHVLLARDVLGDSIGITHFDFHNAIRVGGHESIISELRHIEPIQDNIDKFGHSIYDAAFGEILTAQAGVFRVNCLDCLDRTNFIQDILSRSVLEQYLTLMKREWVVFGAIWSYHRELWAENGDALSRIYAGTGALNTSYTRSGKRTLAGVLSDATKSVSRAYINNFQDKGKQTAIDLFLGNLSNQQQVTIYDPIHDSVQAALLYRLAEYSTIKYGTIFVGTWNLNGRPPTESLLPWLFPRDTFEEPDIFVIGFQEIVPITAQQIVQTDPEKKCLWERTIVDALNERPEKIATYVLLRSEQLVGTALIVLVKSDLLGVIRNVDAAVKKTGLRGMSGNKGAVAVCLDYHDTSFCFLTAHLAAGHANVEERNFDYYTITNGLRFQRGKILTEFNNVIWFGDTNYRIDLENDVVRSLVQSNDLDALVAADQLKNAMDSKSAFVGYEEGPLLFQPTYKYDLYSDHYDSSEKMRIPAWTDRILYCGTQLDLTFYSRAELTTSDHRPVLAIFRAEITVVDHVKLDGLHRHLIDSAFHTTQSENIEELECLPPPSTVGVFWWTDPGTGQDNLALNSFSEKIGVPSNPFFSPTDSPLSSLSDEDLYNDALTLEAPITSVETHKAPPLPPRNTKRI